MFDAIGGQGASSTQIAGDTGTEQRVTDTCVGDTVLVGAHLEQHTKVLGRPIRPYGIPVMSTRA
jgi:hypothetical protein